jgi:outer membrane protein insertion porin family
MHPPRALRVAQAMALVLWLLAVAGDALGQARVPQLHPAPDLSGFSGRSLTRVEVVVQGARWRGARPSVRAEAGQLLSPELVRRSLDELLETGRYADARAEVEADGDGVRLRILVKPRRVIADVRVTGGVLADDVLLRAVGAQVGRELTAEDLERIEQRLRAEHAKHGFPSARASLQAIDTDDPLRVALRIDLVPGPPKRIDLRKFYAWPDPTEPVLQSLLGQYAMNRGDRGDEEQLEAADRKFETLLRVRGFHRATVGHALESDARGKLTLKVNVRADQRMRISFEGNRSFDGDELLAVLSLEETDDRSPESLAEKLRQHYLTRGRLDVQVSSSLRTAPGSPVSDLVFVIREGEPLHVAVRRYPCLTHFKPTAVDAEIDSFLAELPGAELLGPVDPRVTESLYGPTHDLAVRHAPRDFNPYSYYVPDVYEKAVDHLRDLYRSEGYLSCRRPTPRSVVCPIPNMASTAPPRRRCICPFASGRARICTTSPSRATARWSKVACSRPPSCR